MHPAEFVEKIPERSRERFAAKVNFTAGCWRWTAAKSWNGYGQFGIVTRKIVYAHRLSYEWVHGPIPEGLTLDHLCRVRECIRPDHLEAVTLKVNLHRGNTITARNAAKTHCAKGHPYSEENTIRQPAHPTHRRCRTCTKEHKRNESLKLKARRESCR